MASTYSPNLRLELIGTGEQQGTWGSTTNTNLGTLLEEAIGGYTSVTVSNVGDTTLTTNNGSADQSRNMVINLTGTISAARNVICPAIEKLYVVKNATTGGFAVTFKVSGQTGVTIPNGEIYFLYVNGVDAQKIVGNVASTNETNTFTENQIIQVTDNTDAALRITQLGTGNALLVEDSANPDGTPTIITQSGQIVTGYTATVNTDNSYGGQITPRIQTHGTVTDNAALAATLWSASGAASQLILSKSRGAAIGTNAVVQSGDDLGAVAFNGDDGASLIVAAAITASVDGTPGTNDMPGRIAFATTADGASTPTERMRINSLGNVNIGTATNPESALQITGSTTPTTIAVGSISGTTLTVTSIGSPSGPISVGDRLFIAGAGLDYNTYITALGTGTGGLGTYTVNNGTTLASSTISFYPSRINSLTFVDADTTSSANQPLGAVEWYSSDASTPGVGIKAYVAAISEGINAQSSLVLGTAPTTASTQAVERLRIASDGKVGIGTRSADALLSVNGVASFGDGAVGAPSIANFGDLNTGIWFPAEDTIAFSEGGIEVMRINSSANVGIGTSSPGGRLDVQGGTIEFDPGVGADATRALNFNIGGLNYGKILIPSGGGGAMAFWTGAGGAAAERVRITATGSVGIGVTAPSNTLDVNGAVEATTFEVGSASDTTISRSSAGVIAVEGGIVPLENRANTFTAQQNITMSGSAPIGVNVNASSDVTSDRAAMKTGAWLFGQDVSANGTDDFFIYDDNASANRLYISTAGRVGIGTTAPACLLDVAGGVQTSRTTVTAPAATDGNIFSGTYTPTLTGVTNVAASTAYLSQYMRVGNAVTVSGRISIDPTSASALTEIRMSLPIAATFAAQSRCGGTFARGGATTGNCGSISANTANNEAFFAITPSVDTNQDYWFSFTYTLGI